MVQIFLHKVLPLNLLHPQLHPRKASGLRTHLYIQFFELRVSYFFLLQRRNLLRRMPELYKIPILQQFIMMHIMPLPYNSQGPFWKRTMHYPGMEYQP